jgi:hypothetical protein
LMCCIVHIETDNGLREVTMLYGSCKPLVQIGSARLVRPDWFDQIGSTILVGPNDNRVRWPTATLKMTQRPIAARTDLGLPTWRG